MTYKTEVAAPVVVEHKYQVGDVITMVDGFPGTYPATIKAIERVDTGLGVYPPLYCPIYRYEDDGYDYIERVDSGEGGHYLVPKFPVGTWVTWGAKSAAYRVAEHGPQGMHLVEGRSILTGEPLLAVYGWVSDSSGWSQGSQMREVPEPVKPEPITGVTTITITQRGGVYVPATASLPQALREALQNPRLFGKQYQKNIGTNEVAIEFNDAAEYLPQTTRNFTVEARGGK